MRMNMPLWTEQNENDESARFRRGVLGGMNLFSPLVRSAQNYLQSAMANKPQPYQSKYETQIADLYDRIMNRPVFSYNASQDPLFRQYRNQYLREGQRAMQDAIGASTALTGGYGNSWASTAGYQAYGEYLQALNDKLPELEKRAQERYEAEGSAMRDNADLLMNLDNREYGWYRDAMSDWQFDAKLALEQKKFDLQVQKYQSEMTGSAGAGSVYYQPNLMEGYKYVYADPEEFNRAVQANIVSQAHMNRSARSDTQRKTALEKNKAGR